MTKRQQLAASKGKACDRDKKPAASRKGKVMKKPSAVVEAADENPEKMGRGRGRGQGRGRGSRGRGRGMKAPDTWEQADPWTEDEWDEWLKWRAAAHAGEATNAAPEPSMPSRRRRSKGPDTKDGNEVQKSTRCQEEEVAPASKKPRKSVAEEAPAVELEVPEADMLQPNKKTFGGRKQPQHGMAHLKWAVIRAAWFEHVCPHIHVNRSKHEAGMFSCSTISHASRLAVLIRRLHVYQFCIWVCPQSRQ